MRAQESISSSSHLINQNSKSNARRLARHNQVSEDNNKHIGVSAVNIPFNVKVDYCKNQANINKKKKSFSNELEFENVLLTPYPYTSYTMHLLYCKH